MPPGANPVRGDGDDRREQPPPDRAIEPGWLVLAGGAALLVAGVVYDVANADLLDERERASERADLAAYEAADDGIASARVVDFVLYGAGAAAVATGVVLLLISGADEPPTPPVGVSPTTRGAVLTWSGAF